jgi:hypothetical protein
VRLETSVPLENLLTLQLTLSDYRYRSPEDAGAFLRQVLQKVESLPGVRDRRQLRRSFVPCGKVSEAELASIHSCPSV